MSKRRPYIYSLIFQTNRLLRGCGAVAAMDGDTLRCTHGERKYEAPGFAALVTDFEKMDWKPRVVARVLAVWMLAELDVPNELAETFDFGQLEVRP